MLSWDFDPLGIRSIGTAAKTRLQQTEVQFKQPIQQYNTHLVECEKKNLSPLMILLNCNPARYYAIIFLFFLFTSDVDPVLAKNRIPGLCTSDEERFFKFY